MRRQLSRAISDLVHSLRAAGRAWDDFWFTPADPTLLGLIRILTGLMLLYTHAVWGLVLERFFGPRSWLSPELVRTLQDGEYMYSFWWLVPGSSTATWLVYGASMLVLALFTVGLWTRVTSVLSLIVVISFAHRASEAMFGLDQINAMLTLYLAIGPSGQALSLDRLRALRRSGESRPPAPSVGANLALRLINVHMCIIYLFAGVSKLQGESWWTGEAMWRAFANLEYQTADMTWLAWHPWLINLMTHVCILWEVSFCFLVWRPRLRPLMLLGAVVLHVGIGACLGMWTFALIMLVGCMSFLPPSTVRELTSALAFSGRRSTDGFSVPEHAAILAGSSAACLCHADRREAAFVPAAIDAGR
ncbi:MAG: HTTM domain-containing protein [Isosphaeraceae bacterium]